MMKKDLIGVSKFVSLVLRHKPEVLGLKMDDQGWVDVDELIREYNIYQKSGKFNLVTLTRSILDEVVSTNDKKRFAYSEDGWRIRASQGHSVEVDLKLTPTNPPDYLYHGTATQFVSSILKTGLKKMNRQHVHLSATEDTATKVGSRHGKPQILRVRAKDMQKDGFNFFLSANNVWLTEEVPIKYIDVKWSDI